MLNFLILAMPWVALTSWAFLLFIVLHAILNAGPEIQVFWLSVFREDNGTGSAGRVFSAVLFMVMSGLIIYCVIRLIPLPFTLAEATAYALSPYLANKVAKGVDNVFGKAPACIPPDPPH